MGLCLPTTSFAGTSQGVWQVLATLFGTTGASLYYESFATYLSFAIYLGHGQFST